MGLANFVLQLDQFLFSHQNTSSPDEKASRSHQRTAARAIVCPPGRQQSSRHQAACKKRPHVCMFMHVCMGHGRMGSKLADLPRPIYATKSSSSSRRQHMAAPNNARGHHRRQVLRQQHLDIFYLYIAYLNKRLQQPPRHLRPPQPCRQSCSLFLFCTIY